MDELVYPRPRQYLVAAFCLALARVFGTLLAVTILPATELLRNREVILVLGSLCFPFIVLGLLAMLLSFSLRCLACGKRICVVGNPSKIAPGYLARQRGQSLAKKVMDFFLPTELRTGTMHCVQCDQPYRVLWNASNSALQGTRDKTTRP